jgi:hypothetical protein
MAFMSYCRVQLNLKSDTIGGYLSGVRHFLKVFGVDSSFFDSDIVKSTRAGIDVEFRATHARCDERTLPFTAAMIQYAGEQVFVSGSYQHKALLLGMKFGNTTLSRASNYLKFSDNTKFIQSQHVSFTVTAMGSIKRVELWAYEVREEHRAWEVHAINIFFSYKKNDQCGDGSRFFFSRLRKGHEVAFDFVFDMFEWAVIAQLQPRQGFFSYRSQFQLSYQDMMTSLKHVAERLGFNPDRFGTHSLRVAGASALAASGASDAIIKLMGQWRSLAFLQYIVMEANSFDRAMAALVNPRLLDIDSVRKLQGSATN